MPDHHCRECTDAAACGKYHVYVIELEDGARDRKPYRDQDVAGQPKDNGKCLYVGMTAHRASCRLGQHRAWAEDLRTFPCGCFTDAVVQRPFRGERSAASESRPTAAADGAQPAVAEALRGRTRGNRVVGTFANKLKPQYAWRHNPIASQDEALGREAELADELRALGFRVHQA